MEPDAQDKAIRAEVAASITDLLLNAIGYIEKALDEGGEPAARVLIVAMRQSLKTGKPW